MVNRGRSIDSGRMHFFLKKIPASRNLESFENVEKNTKRFNNSDHLAKRKITI